MNNILFVINDLYFGGHVKSFLTQLEYIVANNTYKIFCTNNGYIQSNLKKYEFIDEEKIVYYNANTIRKYNFSFELYKKVDKNIDSENTIIHSYSPECFFSVSLAKTFNKNTFLVASTMGGVYAFPFYNSANIHIAVSNEQIENCKKDYKNYTLIANRINTSSLKLNDNKYDKTLQNKNIYLISRLDSDKKTPLLNSIHILKKLSNKYKIFILGDGEYKNEFEKNLKDNNIDAHFEGMVKNPIEYIENCALVIGMGRSIIEFMLCGYPAILCGYDGSIDLFTEKNTKLAFNSNFSARGIKKKFDVSTFTNKNYEKIKVLNFLDEMYNIDKFQNKINDVYNKLNHNKKTSKLSVFVEYVDYLLLRLINIIKRNFNVKNK